jgi:hypothetical protein
MDGYAPMDGWVTVCGLVSTIQQKGADQGVVHVRLHTMDTLKGYSKALKYEYRVKTDVLGTLKRYSILSLTLYLELYCAYFILYSGGPTS